VLPRERVELRGGGEAPLEAGHGLGDLRAEAGLELRQAPGRFLLARRGEDLAHRLGEPLAQALGRLRQDVPLQVHHAPLLLGLGQQRPRGLVQPPVVVGDDQAHRAPEQALQIGSKFFSRRDHDIGSVIHRGSSLPPRHGRSVWVFTFKGRVPFLWASRGMT
jgi:hypothetical protein